MAAKKKIKKKAPAVRGTVKKAAPKATEPAALGAKKKKASKKAEPADNIIDQVIAKVNTAHGATVIRRASEAATSHMLRRPTGIPDVDIALGGGWPAGALVVVGGPDGAGKDYMINKSISRVQRNYGNDAKVAILSTEFPYDKDYARDKCDVRVADTDEEIAEKNAIRLAKGLPALSDEEVVRLKEQVGEIILIQGVVMDYGLDIILELLSTGAFQLIAINSIGVMETAAKEEVESVSEHATQSSEAQLLSRFIPKMFMLLNRPIDENGARNETTMIAADQVRANRDMPRARPGMRVPEHWKYQAGSGSRALAHGKAIHLVLHKGNAIVDKAFDPPEQIGREINWELTKGKLGTHDGLKGSYEYFYEEGADVAQSLLTVALRYEVVEQAGAWYSYQDQNEELCFHVQGKDSARSALTQPEVFDAVYAKTMAAAKIICRYT